MPIIKLSTPIIARGGEAAHENGIPLTIKSIALFLLDVSLKGDDDLGRLHKILMWDVGKKIEKAEDEIELSSEEATLLIGRADKSSLPANIFGQFIMAIDPIVIQDTLKAK